LAGIARTATAPGTIRGVILGVLAPRRAGVINLGDRVLYNVTRLLAVFVLFLAAFLVFELISNSWEAISKFKLGFLTGTTWDPVAG
jgi:ABC-type phosphate transport system permease subunit